MFDLLAALFNGLSSYFNLYNAFVFRESQPYRFVYRLAFGVLSGGVAIVYFLKLIHVLPTPLPYELMDTMLALFSLVPLIIGIIEYPRKK